MADHPTPPTNPYEHDPSTGADRRSVNVLGKSVAWTEGYNAALSYVLAVVEERARRDAARSNDSTTPGLAEGDPIPSPMDSAR